MDSLFAGLAPGLILGIVAAFLLAGTVKGTVGIGLPTAAVGVMSQFVDPRLAISLVVVPSLLTNAWQIVRSQHFGRTLRRYWLYLACLVPLNGLVAATLAGSIPTEGLILVLGLVIAGFAVMSLTFAPPFLPERFDRAGQTVAGVASGFLGGLTAIWSPPMVTYLMARRIEKDEFVRASGTMVFMGTVPLVWGFWQSGVLTGPGAGLSALMIVPALAGFTLGEVLRRRLNADRFRRVVLLVFLAMGLNLVRRALT